MIDLKNLLPPLQWPLAHIMIVRKTK